MHLWTCKGKTTVKKISCLLKNLWPNSCLYSNQHFCAFSKWPTLRPSPRTCLDRLTCPWSPQPHPQPWPALAAVSRNPGLTAPAASSDCFSGPPQSHQCWPCRAPFPAGCSVGFPEVCSVLVDHEPMENKNAHFRNREDWHMLQPDSYQYLQHSHSVFLFSWEKKLFFEIKYRPI